MNPLPKMFAVALCGVLAWKSTNELHAQSSIDLITTLPDPGAPYAFVTVDISLDQALKLFSRNLRLRLILDENVKKMEMVTLPADLSRIEYLETLALEHDLTWYFDGLVLRVSSLQSIETRVVTLEGINGHTVLQSLEKLGLLQSKYVHKLDARRGVLRVSGPLTYVDELSSAIEQMGAATPERTSIMRGGTGEVGTNATLNPDASSISDGFN